MEIESEKLKTLRLRRIIPAYQAVALVECQAARISVLRDETAAHLKIYQQVIAGKPSAERLSLELDGVELNVREHLHVGFDERMPDETSIQEFLRQAAVPETEIEPLIDRYELRRHTYLQCSQLGLMQARQLWLIAASYSQSPVIFLNDPFLPFNGRWRESFAELLLTKVQGMQRICLVVNLSFTPKCWENNQAVDFFEIDKVYEKSITKAKESERQQDDLAKLAKQAARDENPYYGRKISFVLPENLVFAYRETVDFIFEPMARLANFMRSWSGALAIAGLASVVLMVGIALLPLISGKREILKQIASNFNYSWRDVLKAGSQSMGQQASAAEKKVPVESSLPENTPSEAEYSSVIENHLSDLPSLSLAAEHTGFEGEQEISVWDFNLMLDSWYSQSFSTCLEIPVEDLAPVDKDTEFALSLGLDCQKLEYESEKLNY